MNTSLETQTFELEGEVAEAAQTVAHGAYRRNEMSIDATVVMLSVMAKASTDFPRKSLSIEAARELHRQSVKLQETYETTPSGNRLSVLSKELGQSVLRSLSITYNSARLISSQLEGLLEANDATHLLPSATEEAPSQNLYALSHRREGGLASYFRRISIQ